jgi:hypothetical protein
MASRFAVTGRRRRLRDFVVRGGLLGGSDDVTSQARTQKTRDGQANGSLWSIRHAARGPARIYARPKHGMAWAASCPGRHGPCPAPCLSLHADQIR